MKITNANSIVWSSSPLSLLVVITAGCDDDPVRPLDRLSGTQIPAGR